MQPLERLTRRMTFRSGMVVVAAMMLLVLSSRSERVMVFAWRCVSWPKSKLKDFMNKNPDLHSALKSTLAIDLRRWLHAAWGVVN